MFVSCGIILPLDNKHKHIIFSALRSSIEFSDTYYLHLGVKRSPLPVTTCVYLTLYRFQKSFFFMRKGHIFFISTPLIFIYKGPDVKYDLYQVILSFLYFIVLPTKLARFSKYTYQEIKSWTSNCSSMNLLTYYFQNQSTVRTVRSES